MAKQNIIDLIMNTINDVQQKNKRNPREETADPNVFDLLRGKLQELDEKTRQKRTSRGKSPESILDRIRKEIEGTRRKNKRDQNVPTAPSSVFDNIIKKIDDRPRRQASSGIRKIVEEYNLDVSRLPQEVLRQVQDRYINDRKNFDKQYAQAIFDLIKKY